MSAAEERIEVGRINGAWGTAGWVKVFSLTDPPENIFEYQPWRCAPTPGLFHVRQWRRQGTRLVAQLDEVATRDQAEALAGTVISITAAQFPDAGAQSWYWHDLIGLAVEDANARALGRVAGLIDAGVHDVLRVTATDGGDELLIPFVPEVYVLGVDVDAGRIRVDWDPAWSREEA